ncbi:NAD-dependent methanol dehydrogenase [Histoplasma capsulatum H143]|uniref:NAD-dependent methanol dehydrogenase n=1 Tax=Ajellomyces capsulatus (strain H143) TaxID=544712 RepID=C6HCU7_AJECH|nr:NAD-dependent methanol dehydrogenase [Histoplasma capsulatum H143]
MSLLSIRIAPSAASRALNLLRAVQFTNPPACPCHSNPTHHHHNRHGSPLSRYARNLATPIDPSYQKEYAFEMAASSIRFGPGSTKEVGMDFKNLGAKRVCVVTDSNVAKLDVMKHSIVALTEEDVEFTIYDKVRVEPKDYSIKNAIAFAKLYNADAFLAVGGGSVIDTAKLMNLYCVYPEADFLDFVNVPLGKGLPIARTLRPLIAVPTTAGTGAETTENMKPTLGICDPLNTRTMPSQVHASTGWTSLHSLDHDAIPTAKTRDPQPIHRRYSANPNPISDIFSLQALRSTVKYLPRAVKDPDDTEAQSQMLLAATLAGVGFGNAGVHLCHGMSYPISGQNPGYKHPGYVVDHDIIPHGVSVAVTAPAVFKFTAASNPDRHLAAAEAFGVDISNVKRESAGEVWVKRSLSSSSGWEINPRGLKQLGFSSSSVDGLIEGTIPQQRVLNLAPNLSKELETEKEELRKLFEESMEF